MREGRTVYSAALSLPPSLFQDILHRQRVPAGWTVSIFETSYSIAAVLVERDIGFIFATGFTTLDQGGRWSGAPVVRKPYTPADVAGALARLRPAAEMGGTEAHTAPAALRP